MLKFFRKNAALIGGSIVLFFALTMFSGSLFMGFGNYNQESRSTKLESNFTSLI